MDPTVLETQGVNIRPSGANGPAQYPRVKRHIFGENVLKICGPHLMCLNFGRFSNFVKNVQTPMLPALFLGDFQISSQMSQPPMLPALFLGDFQISSKMSQPPSYMPYLWEIFKILQK